MGTAPHTQALRRRTHAPLLSALVAACLAASATAAEVSDGACIAWPGEIDPLPTASDPDPFAARWARLRAAELSRLAEAREQQDPAEAYGLWLHVECLLRDGRAAARADRLTPSFVVVRRPERRAPAREQSVPGESPPVPPLPAARATSRPEADLGPIDARLAEAERDLDAARFRRVVESIARLREDLARAPASEPMRARRVRGEVLDASAQIALGKPERAAESFVRALDDDPELVLSPTTPPKVRRLLEEVRRTRLESAPAATDP